MVKLTIQSDSARATSRTYVDVLPSAPTAASALFSSSSRITSSLSNASRVAAVLGGLAFFALPRNDDDDDAAAADDPGHGLVAALAFCFARLVLPRPMVVVVGAVSTRGGEEVLCKPELRKRFHCAL